MDSLFDSCKNIKESLEKVMPDQEAHLALCSKENQLEEEISGLQEAAVKKESEVLAAKYDLRIQKQNLNDQYDSRKTELQQKIDQLEKDIKIRQFRLDSQKTHIDHIKEDIKEANEFLLSLQTQ